MTRDSTQDKGNLLITGASGMVGTALREHLQRQLEQGTALPVVEVIGSQSRETVLRGTVEGQAVN